MNDSENGILKTENLGEPQIQSKTVLPEIEEKKKTKTEKTKIKFDSFSFYYGNQQALRSITMEIRSKQITALIGPSGCGKTTLLRSLNRMNDVLENTRHTGTVTIDGIDIYGKAVDPVSLRRKVGMIFQKSNPFPKSVYDNVAFGIKINRLSESKEQTDEIVQRSLERAALWDEVKDRLDEQAFFLSGGQQQRLCIARALAVEPEILLMDEPTGALDPISTARIEELMYELKKEITIVTVTHNLQQAARVSNATAFLYLGEVIEYDKTSRMFTNPAKKQTEDYIIGRFG